MSTEDVPTAVAAARARVDEAARAAGRSPREVALLLAVKTVDVTRIRAALAAGGALIGHNRAQELVAVEPELEDLEHETHFIGALQSNKVSQVLRHASCVQSVDSMRLAGRLSRAAAAREQDLAVFVQVNTSGEETKRGVPAAQGADLAAEVAALEGITVRGFMTIGANSPDPGVVRRSYEALAAVRDEAVAAGGDVGGELSMGMSGDLEIAVAAGATMVRVGSAVFGARGPG